MMTSEMNNEVMTGVLRAWHTTAHKVNKYIKKTGKNNSNKTASCGNPPATVLASINRSQALAQLSVACSMGEPWIRPPST